MTHLRTVVEWGVCLLIAAGMLETWLIAGLAAPCRVMGSSMAATLLGVHRNVVCADCGYPFPCGTDRRPAVPRAVCPNCGYAANDLTSLVDLDGGQLWIDRATFALRRPRRWEIAALRRPRQAGEILIKRVVGLPGEHVEIRHGDVYVDGRIQRKNLTQQHALAVLVHDADYRPTLAPKPPPRWRPRRGQSRWDSAGRCFIRCTPNSATLFLKGEECCSSGRVMYTRSAGDESEPIDWLVYRHWRRAAGGQTSRYVEEPVTDVCGYNQSRPRREEDVHPVADLLLSFRLADASGRGTFYVRVTDGGDDFEARLRFDGGWRGYQAYRAGRPIAGAAGKMTASADGRLVEVSLVDRQFLLALDGRTVVAWPYEPVDPPPSPPTAPLAIGAQGLAVTVGELRVYRDVYYTHSNGSHEGTPTATAARLGAEEYFVLGDNSPISDDSRNWPDRGAVDAKLLVGKPFVAVPSIEVSLWPRWHFQVPNPVGIRYIQ